jgi:hypothetical protein
MNSEQKLLQEIVRHKDTRCGICNQLITKDNEELLTYDSNGNIYHYLCGVIFYIHNRMSGE